MAKAKAGDSITKLFKNLYMQLLDLFLLPIIVYYTNLTIMLRLSGSVGEVTSIVSPSLTKSDNCFSKFGLVSASIGAGFDQYMRFVAPLRSTFESAGFLI